ncbi:MAG: GNAT family N-acetyltransferase [Bacteroidota bacterium]
MLQVKNNVKVMDQQLVLLTSDEEILSSFEIMQELRPKLEKAQYVDLVRQLESECNYQLLGSYADGQLEGLAGFRISRSLAWGKYLYVDDLITSASKRSGGNGKRMMDWLIELAREQGCERIDLDSGVQRFAAHRFYLRERMDILCYHFTRMLD